MTARELFRMAELMGDPFGSDMLLLYSREPYSLTVKYDDLERRLYLGREIDSSLAPGMPLAYIVAQPQIVGVNLGNGRAN